MNRDRMRQALLARDDVFDIVVIGGGATGMGIAVDAAARGYAVVLLEQADFGQGTSSRSTKLIHGGVRYLQQGNVSLVMEALRERGILRRNAPHLVHDQAFVVPNYAWWEAPFYGIGMKVYDVLAGRYGFGKSRMLSEEAVTRHIPTIEQDGLRGGVLYHDGQFDDSRLLMHLALTAADQGAIVLNRMAVTGLVEEQGFVVGVEALDAETDTEHTIRARCVINATGPFADAVRRLEDMNAAPLIHPSQGVHIVLDRSFLPGDAAIMVPRTEDKRVLFAIPWHDRVLIGTTDTSIDDAVLEPTARPDEIEFLLRTAAQYLERDPSPADVLSVFVGIRPLVRAAEGTETAELSRDHTLHISRGGLMTIVGGKWTTYRRMAKDAVDQAATVGDLEPRPCPTEDLRIHGYLEDTRALGHLAVYGSDAEAVLDLARADPSLAAPLHPRLPYLACEVVWGARKEMARHVEDILARRTRALLLDARAAAETAGAVARLMARELGREAAWVERETRAFQALARRYVLE